MFDSFILPVTDIKNSFRVFPVVPVDYSAIKHPVLYSLPELSVSKLQSIYNCRINNKAKLKKS
jgi:hypothetical protein